MLGKPSLEDLGSWLFGCAWRAIETMALWRDELEHDQYRRREVRQSGTLAIVAAISLLGNGIVMFTIDWIIVGTIFCIISTLCSATAWACERLTATDDST